MKFTTDEQRQRWRDNQKLGPTQRIIENGEPELEIAVSDRTYVTDKNGSLRVKGGRKK